MTAVVTIGEVAAAMGCKPEQVEAEAQVQRHDRRPAGVHQPRGGTHMRDDAEMAAGRRSPEVYRTLASQAGLTIPELVEYYESMWCHRGLA